MYMCINLIWRPSGYWLHTWSSLWEVREMVKNQFGDLIWIRKCLKANEKGRGVDHRLEDHTTVPHKDLAKRIFLTPVNHECASRVKIWQHCETFWKQSFGCYCQGAFLNTTHGPTKQIWPQHLNIATWIMDCSNRVTDVHELFLHSSTASFVSVR